MKKIFGFYLSFLLAFLSIQAAFASDEQAIEEVVMRGSSLKRSAGIEDLWAVDATDAIDRGCAKYAMASDSQTWAATSSSAKITICDFEKNRNMLDCVYSGLLNVLTEEELNYVSETHIKLVNGEIQDCSILDPYIRKINFLCYYEEDLDISHLFPFTNEFFSQFPNLEEIKIKTNQSQVPENLFHGLPHLKVVEIRGNNIETLPTDLFKQNNQLLEFDMLSDSFRGVDDPKFFRNFPLIEVLRMTVHRPDVIWHPPNDICTHNKHLVNMDLGRGSGSGSSRTPSSCCTRERLKMFTSYNSTKYEEKGCSSIRD